ncbi:MAG: copper amine oxidase N-terminal domain-containing protein [Clostridiales bacterium]|jgi:hypothetical protein|nr:copper amine oxidase N-terminal domain-containing protein [Clostridiales bacterium]
MKKLLFLLAVVLCCASAAVAADKPIGVLIDGAALETDVPPVIQNDRVLVPLRAISEALFARVEWNDDAQMVTVFNGASVCLMTIGSPHVVVIGADDTNIVTLDVPPMIQNDRTLLPIRFFAEFFGCNVDWQPQDDLDLVVITRE